LLPQAAKYESVFLFPVCLNGVISAMTTDNSTMIYSDDGVDFNGYLALPSGVGRRPCVLVVHEWWGLNDYVRGRADQLAELGYAALAVDMYGDGRTAESPDDAMALMQSVTENDGATLARFQAAVDALANSDRVDNDQLAAIGYCFGGAVVLAAARAGLPLRGVASFHGNLATAVPAKAGEVTARIKVFHGNADAMIPQEQVDAFRAEMDAAGADFEVVGYDGAGHGFTSVEADENQARYGLPVAYNQAADLDSWSRLRSFLAELFD
jgi:dienelactone hydrolase